MKVFVVGDMLHYADFITDVELVDDIEQAQVVLFTGGEDVDPSLYGQPKEWGTYSNLARDKAEQEVFNKVKPNQVCLGICRGSQFLCVMNGGLLVQDVSGHALRATHRIVDAAEDRCFHITSTHHQMQYPFNLEMGKDFTVLYYSSERRSNHYIGGGINSELILDYGEPEIVLYHVKGKPKCLAVQGHPEMMLGTAICDEINDILTSIVQSVE